MTESNANPSFGAAGGKAEGGAIAQLDTLAMVVARFAAMGSFLSQRLMMLTGSGGNGV